MTASTLPDTLSGLIAAAISDARSLDRSRYLPHAREWHVPEQGRCLVCLSGALMAGSLKANPKLEYAPSDFDPVEMDKLFAINKAREGYWIAAWKLFYGGSPSPSASHKLAALPAPLIPCFVDWTEFDNHLRSLEQIAARLRTIEALAAPG